MRERVLEELRRRPDPSAPATNAREAAQQRFGVTGADAIVRPTLEKLWGSPAEALSPHALHCFYDLRRLVVCEKADADRLKQDPRLDEVIANPDQSRPAGEVFGGRVGLTFRTQVDDLEQRVSSWADRVGITLRFGANVSARDGVLAVDDQPVSGTFDACIMAVPLHQFLDATHVGADRMELSICYVQLTEHVDDRFPSYYVLAHDPAFRASRIVNYDAYNGENPPDRPSVLAIEAVHAPDAAPSVDALTAELRAMFPHLTVDAAWALPRSVPVLSPTVRNGRLLDALQASLAAPFADKPVFFTGMRTDTGVFFSHHTIGLAHDSALACHARLA
jgi:protoporphyrinogen oxidase